MKTGIELIAMERKEQIEKHQITVELDVVNNSNFELSKAAMFLCGDDEYNKLFVIPHDEFRPDSISKECWEKMTKKPYVERLVIAGALIAAEIDRLIYNEFNKEGEL
jgi:hypothetical protein